MILLLKSVNPAWICLFFPYIHTYICCLSSLYCFYTASHLLIIILFFCVQNVQLVSERWLLCKMTYSMSNLWAKQMMCAMYSIWMFAYVLGFPFNYETKLMLWYTSLWTTLRCAAHSYSLVDDAFVALIKVQEMMSFVGGPIQAVFVFEV